MRKPSPPSIRTATLVEQAKAAIAQSSALIEQSRRLLDGAEPPPPPTSPPATFGAQVAAIARATPRVAK